jgi:thiamine-monophosphate kinase
MLLEMRKVPTFSEANASPAERAPQGREGRTLGERALIERIRHRGHRKAFAGLALGIGDDCALLETRPQEQVAVTTDLSLAGRHFRLDWHPPEVVGHRTLARGLSDLAAMGARPLAAFLSLGLPANLTRSRGSKSAWIDRFFDGFLALASTHNTPLAGGDLAEAQVAVADIVLVGAVPRNRALLRSGARAGDLIYVTGTLGGAAAGLAALKHLGASRPVSRALVIPKKLEPVLAPHFYPQPRLAQGLSLQRRRLAHAAIDLSDGLSIDLAHLCEESEVAAEVDPARLPLAPGATLRQALHGGEDYELLFAAPAETRIPRTIAGVAVTQIGSFKPRRSGQPLVAIRTGRRLEPLPQRGWEHFG